MSKPKPPDLSHIEPDLWSLARPITDFVLDPRQARDHDERSIAEIKDSLKLGQKKPIFVSRKGMIVAAGNGTVVAALELGWTHLAAVVSDDTEAAIREYAIRDNRSAEFARWRPDVVKTELVDLDIKPEEIGWEADEWTGVVADGMVEGFKFNIQGRKDDRNEGDVSVRLRFHPAVWLAKRDELKAIINRVVIDYEAKAKIDE